MTFEEAVEIARANNPKVPQARIYSLIDGDGWFYRIEDEQPVGPFEEPLEAGNACRAELIRRAEAKEALK